MSSNAPKAASSRATYSFSEFRSNPSAVAAEALKREVAIVVSDKSRVIVARQLEPLD